MQRANLDILSKVPALQEVLAIPTSISGIEDVDRGLASSFCNNSSRW